MIRTRWLAALILASTPRPCQAQSGGMGGGVGGGGRGMPTEEWTVKVEVQNDQAVTGRLKLQGVVVQCDLGLYRIKPEKIKAIEFDPKKEEPVIIGDEGLQRRATVVTLSGEKIAGIVYVPHTWEVETDLGRLKPEAQNLKVITFLERVPDRQPGAGKPSGPQKPGGQGGGPDASAPADPAK